MIQPEMVKSRILDILLKEITDTEYSAEKQVDELYELVMELAKIISSNPPVIESVFCDCNSEKMTDWLKGWCSYCNKPKQKTVR